MVTAESSSARATKLASNLTPNQLKTARYFQQNATMTLTLSTDQLAEKIGVSTASVIRTAQALGYEGLSELKRALADELNEKGSKPASVIGRRLKTGDSSQSRLHSVLHDSIATLDETATVIDPSAWNDAASLVADSTSTFAYGIEESGQVAELFTHLLRTFGFNASAYSQTGRSFAPFVAAIRRATCVVVFVPLRLFPEIGEILQVADVEGIRTIVVTEIVDTSFVNADSVVLTTPSTVLTNTENILSPFVVAYALAQEAGSRARAESMDAYNEMLERRERL